MQRSSADILSLALIVCFLAGMGCRSIRPMGPNMPLGKIIAGPDEPLLETGLGTNSLPWLDKIHARDSENLMRSVKRIDALFAEKGMALPYETNSSFRVRTEADISDFNNPSIKARANLHADLYLPNIERRMHVFVETFDPDKLPGKTAFEQKEALFIGLRRVVNVFEMQALDLSAGARWSSKPVAFARAKVGHFFTSNDWRIYPEQTAFWLTDDGFGEKTTLVIERSLGENTTAQSVTSALYSETSQGLEWQQSISLKFVAHGTLANPRKMLFSQLSCFGHVDEQGLMDTYRWDFLSLRMPFYRDWVYFELTPRVEWANADDWTAEWSMILTVDVLYR